MSLETLKLQGNPFEGANIQTFKDATGAVFFIYCGTNPNDPTFKQQVARLKNGKYTWYSVPHANHPRPTGTLEHDGLYVTYFSDEVGTLRRWKVTDFVMPAASTSTPTVPPAGEVVDVTARLQVEALRKELNELKKQMQQRPTGGLTWLQIKDHLWNDNIINDKVYSDLAERGGIHGMIQAIIREEIS